MVTHDPLVAARAKRTLRLSGGRITCGDMGNGVEVENETLM